MIAAAIGPCAFFQLLGNLGIFRWRIFFWQAGADQPFDIAQQATFLAVTKSNRGAVLARARRPANTVDIGFGHIGQIEIEHMGHIIDINTACGNIGRNQNTCRPCLERL